MTLRSWGSKGLMLGVAGQLAPVLERDGQIETAGQKGLFQSNSASIDGNR